MANQVILIKGEYRVVFQGQIVKGAYWAEKGPAQTCLGLLERGVGTLTADGYVKWNLQECR